MEVRFVVALAVLAALAAVAYLGFSILSLKWNDKHYKTIGLNVALFIGGVAALLVFTVMLKNGGPPDFMAVTPGPAQGMGSITRQILFPVTETAAQQFVELTPIAQEKAEGSVEIVYRVEDPQGKQLTSGRQNATASEGRKWGTLRFAFEAETTGNHKLVLEIPQAVDQAHVVVKEVL